MLLFFSGGLDSTVLGWDILTCPARYGISLEGRPILTLLTAAFSPEERRTKRKNLRGLVEAMRGINPRVEVEHRIVVVPSYLISYDRKLDVVEGSVEIHTAARPNGSSVSLTRQYMSSHYTPGLHLFLATVAINLLHRDVDGLSPHHNPPQAFWGFKFEGPVWEAIEAGQGARSDTTREFVDATNNLADTLGHSPTPVFRAPLLENRMDRYQTVVLAKQLGVPIEMTSSCINGWMANCGHCRQCMVRNQALAAYSAKHSEE